MKKQFKIPKYGLFLNFDDKSKLDLLDTTISNESYKLVPELKKIGFKIVDFSDLPSCTKLSTEFIKICSNDVKKKGNLIRLLNSLNLQKDLFDIDYEKGKLYYNSSIKHTYDLQLDSLSGGTIRVIALFYITTMFDNVYVHNFNKGIHVLLITPLAQIIHACSNGNLLLGHWRNDDYAGIDFNIKVRLTETGNPHFIWL